LKHPNAFLGKTRKSRSLGSNQDQGWDAEQETLPMVYSRELKPINNGMASYQIALRAGGHCT
jgi:hypothetical protein